MAETSATAEGTLGKTPLAHLLVYALDRRLSGALFLTQADGTKHVVRLARGAPIKVRPGDRYALLGEMLVEAGAIDEATLDAALATKGLLGDVLLLAGRVERDVLETIAETQFVRRLVRLFDLPADTAYAYFDGHEELADYGGDPACVDPLAILWAGLRVHAERSASMEGTVTLLGDKPIRLHPAATIARFGLEEPEAKLHEHLCTKAATIDELIALGAAPPEIVRRFVYALLITRQLELGTGTLPLGAAESAAARASAPGAPPGSASAAVARMQLKSTVHRVGAAAPDLPGDGERGPAVVGNANRSGVRRARDLRAEDAPVSEQTSGLADPSSDIKPVVGIDAAPAPAPDSGVAPSPATTTLRSQPSPTLTPADAAPAPAPEADPLAGKSTAELVQLARERLAERDAKAAVAACEAARKSAPEEPDVIALAAWVRFQAGAADVKALTIELDELLALHEAHVPARYYRAMLRKRLSNQAGCVSDLQKLLELSPGHADAKRELSALTSKPAAKERPSLFGRLFKR